MHLLVSKKRRHPPVKGYEDFHFSYPSRAGPSRPGLIYVGVPARDEPSHVYGNELCIHGFPPFFGLPFGHYPKAPSSPFSSTILWPTTSMIGPPCSDIYVSLGKNTLMNSSSLSTRSRLSLSFFFAAPRTLSRTLPPLLNVSDDRAGHKSG